VTASTGPVLVAYASKHESTAEIAERIAAAMRSAGCDAQARPAAEVDDLSGYAAVVLGSAVYAKRWRREARSFARRHAAALRDNARVAVQQRAVRRCRRASDRTDAARRGAARGAVGRAGQRHVRGARAHRPGNFVERRC
jgi:menaquinone-dependent protoporphyrinogen oxidase